MPLPPCPTRFAARKAAILAQLAQPDDAYADASPKGAVDAGVRPLLAVINGIDGFVTTSSCAGRAAVFVEGRRQRPRRQNPGTETETAAATTTTASSGGKGGGGTWLYVSHDPLLAVVDDDGYYVPQYDSYRATDWAAELGLGGGAAVDGESPGDDAYDPYDEPNPRLVHLKFEPMILHVLTASLAHAQLLLRCAAAAGFRESGAVSIHHEGPPPAGASSSPAARDDDAALPIVAVRSMGLGFSSVIGVVRGGDGDGDDDANGDAGAAETAAAARCVVSPAYLAQMARVVDERFAVNRQRTERFRAALVDAVTQDAAGGAAGGSSSRNRNGAWEDAEARRARKRAEGLRQQAALRARRTGPDDAAEAGEDELLGGGLG